MVTRMAMSNAYTKWYKIHQKASLRIYELEKEVDDMKMTRESLWP